MRSTRGFSPEPTNGTRSAGAKSWAAWRDRMKWMTGIAVTSHAEMLYLSTIRLVSERAGVQEVGSAFSIADENDERFLVTARHVVDAVKRTTLHLYTGTSVQSL